jgi:hypothetical protein
LPRWHRIYEKEGRPFYLYIYKKVGGGYSISDFGFWIADFLSADFADLRRLKNSLNKIKKGDGVT